MTTYKENTSQVFLDVITEVKAFDEAHEDEDTCEERATTKCNQTLHWLHDAINVDDDENVIAHVHLSNCVNDALSTKLKEFMSSNLTKPRHGNQSQAVLQELIAPLQQLVASSRTTQEALLKLTEAQVIVSSSSTSDDSFAKIPESCRNMLFNASSTREAKPSVLQDQEM